MPPKTEKDEDDIEAYVYNCTVLWKSDNVLDYCVQGFEPCLVQLLSKTGFVYSAEEMRKGWALPSKYMSLR